MFFLLLLVLPGVRTQDPTLPSYSPRSQQLSFDTVQFVQHKPAKKGPILFPNDAPPPPPTPLIVTSRPLSESIARSELNPNNSLAAQSQYHQVTYKPNYLARGKNYEPYSYTLAAVTPVYDYDAYADTGRITPTSKENLYEDHEVEKKPMRRKIQYNEDKSKHIHVLDTDNSYSADHHQNKSGIEFNDDDNNFDFDFIKLYLRDVKPLYDFNARKQHNAAPKVDQYKYQAFPAQFRSKINVDEHDYDKENSEGDNYAFSYRVKDQKTGDDFSHSQKSTGSATNGEYRVRLPDGRMQIVSYTADENGYKADVRYDEHHEQDNSIDFNKDEDKEYLNNNFRNSYNQNFGNTYYHRPQQNVQKIPTSYNNKPTKNYKSFDYENDNDHFQYQSTLKPIPSTGYQFVYPTKSVYVDTTRANINNLITDGFSDNNNDFLEHYNSKIESNDNVERRVNGEDEISDETNYSKEDTLDYSSELDQSYLPHKSKFSSFAINQNVQANVRPSYTELKHLFVTNVNDRRNAAIGALPAVSTVRPVYAVTPENVVAITPKKPNLYTSIKNIASATPISFLYSTPSPSTPKSYLLSTIANLKHQIKLANKPVLSDHYINKINKYLTYTNPSKIDG